MVLRLTVTTTGDSVATWEFTFDAAEVTVGRSASCTVQLPFPTVSGHHLTLLREGGSYLVADVGSTNGTTLNGRPIERDHYVPLRHGDRIVLTDVTLQVSFLALEGSERTGEETGEQVRRMALHYLGAHEPTQDNAVYLDVLQGPDRGERLSLPNTPFRLQPGVGAVVSGAQAWALTDTRLPAGTFTLGFDGHIHTLSPSGPTETYVDGYAIDPGTTVRLRSGSRIHSGHTTFLFVDPLSAWLEKLEPAVVEREPRRQTAPQLRISVDDLDDEEERTPSTFEAGETKRVARAIGPASVPPRTTAGLPLRSEHEPAFTEIAHEELPAESSTTGRSWSGLDIALLLLAITLGSGAVVVFLVLFDIL